MKILAALTLLGAAATSHAGVPSTWTLASAWASNVDFCAGGATACLDADYEVDLYRLHGQHR